MQKKRKPFVARATHLILNNGFERERLKFFIKAFLFYENAFESEFAKE